MSYLNKRRRQGSAARSRGISLGVMVVVALSGITLLNSCTPPQHSVPTAAAPGSRSDQLPERIDFSRRVTRTVDGDTFWISSQNVSIRVWGLDAPETNQPGGSNATVTLTRLISGQTLYCRQRDTDRYGRIVGQCFLPDGRDITAAMIESGVATEYCRYSGNYYRTC
jgi:micrococcal nuclease